MKHRTPHLNRPAHLPTVILLSLCSLAAQAADTLSVEQIRPGQKGYGLTVFSGFKIERFGVEVIDVLEGFLPKQDLILMRGDHPVMNRAGTIRGTSGSPIYINGKLVGALAYGWRFAKGPVFGVTPIKNMLELRKRKLRHPPALVSQKGISDDPKRTQGSLGAMMLASLRRQDNFWRPLFRSRPVAPSATFVPMTVPLNIAGVSAATVPNLKKAFESFGFEPVQGGGTGRAEGPKTFQAGSALGVQLVRGDVSMAGTGTVTWTDGQQVIGFGHSMFNAGEVSFPAVTAKINHTLASAASSFKMSSPARVLGALVQDRQPGIVADTRRRARMIPMTVTLRTHADKSVYRVQMADHPLLTPSLATSVISSAISEVMSDVDQASFDVTTRIRVAGYPALRLTDQRHSSSGLQMGGMVGMRGLQALRAILSNPFRRVPIERMDVDIRVTFGEQPLVIEGVRVKSNRVLPGSRVPIEVAFRHFGGRRTRETYHVDVPATLRGSLLRVDVASGQLVKPEVAKPENLGQLLVRLQKSYPARAVVISLEQPAEGLKVRGRVIHDLPRSVVDALRTGASVRETSTFRSNTRQVFKTSQIVVGRGQLRLRVEDETGT